MLKRCGFLFVIFSTILVVTGCARSVNPEVNVPDARSKTAQRIFGILPQYVELTHQSWPHLYVSRLPLRVGMHDASMPMIYQRLVQLGDLQAYPDGSKHTDYNHAIFMAISRFQWRHGLKPDGELGKKTLAALNVTPAQRLRQLKISMNRWAKFPENEGSHYILVNAANYRLSLVKDGNEVMDMRVVVGRPSRKTPELYSKVNTIVFNPKWNVPSSILHKDIIPKVIKDPEYLEKNNIGVFTGWGKHAKRIDPSTIDWKVVQRNGRFYHFTQMPGDQNALGRVKFLFSNDQDIYLHDTPKRELFNEVKRAFSSGCVRVEQPFRLVEYILRNNDDIGHEALSKITTGHEMKYVKIKNPLPIYITYITAWVDKVGKAHFREDVYKHDV